MLKKIIFADDFENVIYNIFSNFINKKYFKKYGDNVKFAKPLFVKKPEHISIGDNVTIRTGARIEIIDALKGRKLFPELTIGDYVSIEQNCHIVCANKLFIGCGTLISSNVFITDCSHVYSDINKRVLLQGLTIKKTYIGDNSFVGAGAKIMSGVHIGKHCIVGANCVVNSDVPDNCVIVGIPGKIIKKYNSDTNKWEKYNGS